MVKLLIGLVLIIAPFLLTKNFRDKRKGLLVVALLSISFHLIFALGSQFLGYFNYSVVLTANLLFVGACLLISGIPKKIKKPDFAFIFVLTVAFICLFSVHFNYTGDVTMADRSVEEKENMVYPYPYFADEWYAVSFIDYSIDSQKLPIVNPLTKGKGSFLNMELPFHSFLSSVFLLLGLNPLTKYTLVTIFFNLFIVSLVYLFLKINKVEKLNSAIAALSVIYITSTNNLPGIWNLFPITLGIISALIGFCFISIKDRKMAILASVLVFLFYPPLLPFYLIGLTIFLFEFGKKKALRYILAILLAITLVSGFFFYLVFKLLPNSEILNYLWQKIYHPAYTNGIPQFSFYYIVPFAVFLIAPFSIVFLFKKAKWLLIQIILGTILWFFYSINETRIFLEYERLVFYTSILFIIAFGIGLQEIINFIKKKSKSEIGLKLKYAQLAVLGLFLLFSPLYTNINNSNWDKLVLVDKKISMAFPPGAPANNYLKESDLKIFEGIEEKLFLSIPWKGTVIGVATNNYPISTKGGTITINENKYNSFMESDCREKEEKALKWRVDYVYSPPFNCEKFREIKKSEEKLVLYEFTSKN